MKGFSFFNNTSRLSNILTLQLLFSLLWIKKNWTIRVIICLFLGVQYELVFYLPKQIHSRNFIWYTFAKIFFLILYLCFYRAKSLLFIKWRIFLLLCMGRKYEHAYIVKINVLKMRDISFSSLLLLKSNCMDRYIQLINNISNTLILKLLYYNKTHLYKLLITAPQ